MREFEQMEMQFFVPPGEEIKWYKYWKEARMNWHQSLGIGEENYRFHKHKNFVVLNQNNVLVILHYILKNYIQ